MGKDITEPFLGASLRRRRKLSAKWAASRPATAAATASGGASTTSRYFRLTVHEASAPDGAVVNELKLRVLNKDRMPIGQLERAALAGRGDLYPQSLLGRQVYWTVLGEFDQPEEALFDEYGNLEPQRGSGQTTPLLRLGGALHGAPASAAISQSLVDGSLPIPTVVWSAQDIELRVTALAHAGAGARGVPRRQPERQEEDVWIARAGGAPCPDQSRTGSMAGTPRSTPFAVEGSAGVGQRPSPTPRSRTNLTSVAIADFDGGDVIRLHRESDPDGPSQSLRSDSALLSAAFEFAFSLAPGSQRRIRRFRLPMRDRIAPSADEGFSALREAVVRNWRDKIGPRKITVGDREVSDTVEAQTALILVNADRHSPSSPVRATTTARGFATAPRRRSRCSGPGLMEEAKPTSSGTPSAFTRTGWSRRFSTSTARSTAATAAISNSTRRGSLSGSPPTSIASPAIGSSSNAVFEPVVRATKFIEELCARTNAR